MKRLITAVFILVTASVQATVVVNFDGLTANASSGNQMFQDNVKAANTNNVAGTFSTNRAYSTTTAMLTNSGTTYTGPNVYGGLYAKWTQTNATTSLGMGVYRNDNPESYRIQLAGAPAARTTDREAGWVLAFATGGSYGFDANSTLTLSNHTLSADTVATGRWLVVSSGTTYLSQTTINIKSTNDQVYADPDATYWAAWTPDTSMSFGTLTFDTLGSAITNIALIGMAVNYADATSANSAPTFNLTKLSADLALSGTLPDAPAAPTNLTATALSSSAIALAWTDNATNESNYAVERKTGTNDFALIVSLSADTVAYTNTGLSPSTEYFYRIKAVNGGGSSAYITNSATTQVLLPPVAPTGLVATVINYARITLVWTDLSDNETGFVIERSTNGVDFAAIATNTASDANFNNTGLQPDTTYYFRVKAYNASGDSDYSNTDSKQTGPIPQPSLAIISDTDFAAVVSTNLPIVNPLYGSGHTNNSSADMGWMTSATSNQQVDPTNNTVTLKAAWFRDAGSTNNFGGLGQVNRDGFTTKGLQQIQFTVAAMAINTNWDNGTNGVDVALLEVYFYEYIGGVGGLNLNTFAVDTNSWRAIGSNSVTITAATNGLVAGTYTTGAIDFGTNGYNEVGFMIRGVDVNASIGIPEEMTFSSIAAIPEGSGPVSYTLTASAVGNGTVSPTNTSVTAGGSTNFVITAATYYRIASLTTNGTPVVMTLDNNSTATNLTWSNVQAAGALLVTFSNQIANDPAGTPYEWLAFHYGPATTNFDQAAVSDTDTDGLQAWQEYIAGTDPTIAASTLKAIQNSRNTISWNAVTGRVYSVYWSTNLVQGFTALNTNMPYPQSSYTNATPDSRVNHYQVKVRLQ